ncbi:hypothetical protein [Rhizobium laguerreae]|nr:hypothetical protein [Rhizobium laguerreae]
MAIECMVKSGAKGANVVVDGMEIFYPSINYWDLDGFVKEVLSA